MSTNIEKHWKELYPQLRSNRKTLIVVPNSTIASQLADVMRLSGYCIKVIYRGLSRVVEFHSFTVHIEVAPYPAEDIPEWFRQRIIGQRLDVIFMQPYHKKITVPIVADIVHIAKAGQCPLKWQVI